MVNRLAPLASLSPFYPAYRRPAMLGVKTYPREYVDSCRAKFAADTAAFDAIAKDYKGPGDIAGLETAYFGNLLLLLDYAFVHRLRTVEGKDGNALNEVRVLANSMLVSGGVMTPEANIKLVPAKSVLGIEAGTQIQVGRDSFTRLCDAFFAEIEKKFA